MNESDWHDVSTVVAMTGLTAANLRVWEQRYGALTPRRSTSGRRLYSSNDVRRIQMLKTLSEHGRPIRMTANRTSEELETLLAGLPQHSESRNAPTRSLSPKTVRTLVIGRRVSALLRPCAAFRESEISARFDNLSELEKAQELPTSDILIVEIEALFEDTARFIRRAFEACGAARGMILYSYSQNSTLSRFNDQSASFHLRRAPVGPFELQKLYETCARDDKKSPGMQLEERSTTGEPDESKPTRTFTDDQLVEIAQVSTAIECECPHHLATLVTSLLAFEDYSAQCVNRSPDDATMHEYLRRTTAAARATIEEALLKLAQYEGITLETMVAQPESASDG